jgi:hypothetical protein
MRQIPPLALALLAASVAMIPTAIRAQSDDAPEASIKGKISSVDASDQILIINSRAYQVRPTTRITSDNKPAKLSELEVGSSVAARYKQGAEDKLELISVDAQQAVGGPGESATAQSGASFSGKVSKVNPSTKTITVGDQTYHLVPTTQLSASDQPANFADIQVGTQLSGQYRTAADQRRELLSVDIQAVGGSGDTAERESGTTFSGSISQVNTANQTLTIDNRVYHISPTTTVTTADGKPGAVANLKANQKVAGTFKQADNGSYELLSLRVSAGL